MTLLLAFGLGLGCGAVLAVAGLFLADHLFGFTAETDEWGAEF